MAAASRDRHRSRPAGASPTVSMRSAICDRSLNRARPTMRPRGLWTTHGVAARGERVGDVGPVDPRMAAADPVFAAAADHDLGFVCRCHVGPAFSGRNAARPRAAPLHHAESRPGNRVESRGAHRHRRRSRRVSPQGHHQGAARRAGHRRTRTSAPATAASVDYPDFAAGGRPRRRSTGAPTAASSSAAPASAWRSPPTRFPASAPRWPGTRPPPGSAAPHNDANVLALGGRHDAGRQRVDGHPARLPARHGVRGRPPRSAASTKIAASRTQGHHEPWTRPSPPHRRSLRRDRSRRSPAPSATRSRRQANGPRADRLGELRQPRRARGRRLGADEQVRRRLSRQALLRRLRVRRRRRALAIDARQGAVRRRARQRAAALRRAGEHGGVLHAAQARRHGPRHEPVARRPPHARPPAQLLRQALHDRALRRAPGRRADRLRRARAPGATSTSRR